MSIKSLQLSNSSINILDACPRRLEFRKFHQTAFLYQESHASDVGKALHKAIQVYYKNQNKQEAIFTLMKEYPYHYNETAMSGRSLYAAYSTLQLVIQKLDTETLAVAHFDTAKHGTIPGIELCFLLKIKNFSLSDQEAVPVTYIGYIDLVLQNKLTGEFLVYDVKTHRRTNAQPEVEFAFDDQCVPYALVLQHLTGKVTNSIQVNYLFCYTDVLAPVVQTIPMMKTKELIIDWGKQLAKHLQDVKFYYQNQWFPRKSKACFSWGRTCQYFDMCQSRNESIIDQWLIDNKPANPKPAMRHDPALIIELDLGF